MTDNEGSNIYEELPASQILALIKDGKEVKYHHKIIKGDLDIRKLSEENKKFLITAPIYITFSQFTDNVYFSDTIFKEAINFGQSKFNEYVYFDNSQFCSDAYFICTQFCHATPFGGSEFNKIANFYGAKFYGPAYLGSVFFGGDADFSYSHFNRRAFFSGSEFKKTASFANSHFDHIADFWGAFFNDNANFNDTEFSEKANFESASFNKVLKLDASRIYFMNLFAKFNEGSTISLKHSDFFKLEVNWDDIKDKFEYDGSAYLALVKNYNNLEWFDEADKCYYQYKLKKASQLKGLSRCVDFLFWIAYGYGVRPEFPLFALVVIFLVFSGIYLLEDQANYPEIFRLSATVLTTTTETGNLTGDCTWWSIIERIAGWLLMASFLVVLARKTIR